jgi:3-methyl-2-oxobutanoate hydroxymethyltransferase
VETELTAKITQSISVPTIGIGSGNGCDGQILVTHDLVGSFPWFRPKFVQPKMEATRLMQGAVQEWRNDWESLYQKQRTRQESDKSSANA